jgi:hypothetical protein
VATTVPFGPTMSAPCGPTWRHRDGWMWPRFRRHREERATSEAGPNQADMSFPTIGVGPLQGVMVEPTQAVLTTPVSGHAEGPRDQRRRAGERWSATARGLEHRPRNPNMRCETGNPQNSNYTARIVGELGAGSTI